MGSLALRPDDSLTIPTMVLSIGFRNSVSFLSAIQATGLLTFTPVGLLPTEHASFSWTHPYAQKGLFSPSLLNLLELPLLFLFKLGHVI
jgi:hypothetical protein